MSAKDNDAATELLIQEVDEELRREQYLKLWRRYGGYVVALVIGIVVVVAGYQGWHSWQERARQAESARFQAAAELVTEGKTAEGIDALAKLAAEGRTGYTTAALMAIADLKAHSGDFAGAREAYDKVAKSNAPSLYRDLAVLKGALMEIDQGDSAAVEGPLNGLTALGNPWRYSALEALAASATKRGDGKRAAELYRQLADDLAAPQGVRARAAEMLAAIPAAASPSGPTPSTDKTKG